MSTQVLRGSIGEAVTEVAAGSTGGLGAVAADGLTAGATVGADGSIAEVMGAEAPGSIAGRAPGGRSRMPREIDRLLRFLPAALVKEQDDQAFVAIVRDQDELRRCLGNLSPGLEWIQVEGLLCDPDAWTMVARDNSHVAIDVVLSKPDSEFSDLYRLVDVCAARDVRVTIPALPGLAKAVRLAASLRLPVRILPAQPAPEVLAELAEVLEFYLHEPMVEAPVEFFQSVLSNACGAQTGSLWEILEEDPGVFLRYDIYGRPTLPRTSARPFGETSFDKFVENHLAGLVEAGAECEACPWQQVCRGYFKWPEPAYSCGGIKQLFFTIEATSAEIGRELASGKLEPS
jgi:hypothetical protein